MRWAGAFLLCLLFTAPAAAVTLKVAVRALPVSLGNPFTSVGQPASEAWGAIFDALTYIDGDGVLRPALAESWAAPSPTAWVFRLRRNVTFQNGEPLDAAAVVETIEFLRTAAGRGFYVAPEVGGIVSVRAADPHTVIISTGAPDAILPTRLSLVAIVAPRAWSRGLDRFAQAPVGTGPFTLVDWGAGARARLAAFPASWRPPGLDALEFHVLPEASARLQALLAESVDVATGLSHDDFALLPAGRFNTYAVETAAVFAIALRNVGNPGSPLADARVRRALNHAVDVRTIAATIFGGAVAPASQGAQQSTLGFNPALAPFGYDPVLARRLLSEAGYPRGFPLTIDVLVGFASEDAALYQKVADDLGQIGVRVTLRSLPYATWLQKYASGAWGDADAFSARWDSGGYYDTIRAITAASCDKPSPFFCEPALMGDIRATSAMFDGTERRRSLQAIMARLRHEIVPAIWLVPANFHVATSTRVGNFTAREHGLRYDALTLQPQP